MNKKSFHSELFEGLVIAELLYRLYNYEHKRLDSHEINLQSNYKADLRKRLEARKR